jgi:hypothetical protein
LCSRRLFSASVLSLILLRHSMWLPPALIPRALSVTSSLTLNRIATAAELAGSFSLSRVWSSTEPTTRDEPFSTNTTLEYLYDNWNLEGRRLGGGGVDTLNFVEDPYGGQVAVGDPLVLSVKYPKGQKGGTQFWPLPFANGSTPQTAVFTYQVRLRVSASLTTTSDGEA